MVDGLHAAAWALVPLYAMGDRGVGAGKHRSASFLAVVGLSCGVSLITGLWQVAAFSLVWGIDRSLPFKGLFGSSTPHGGAILATLFRYSIPALVAAGVWLEHLGDARLPVCLAGYALAATGLGVLYASIVDGAARKAKALANQNTGIEITRGAAYGLSLALWATLA